MAVFRFRARAWGGDVRGVESARRAWPRRDGVLLGVLEGDRLLGLGEATPLPGFGRDSLSAATEALASLPELDALPSEVETVAALASSLAPASPSARFALETALLDALARRRGLALGALLGAERRSAPRAVLIGALADDDVVARAREAVARGARTLKLKVTGHDPRVESERLADLSRSVGVALRLDLNGGLDVPSARAALQSYAAAGVELVEEPVSGRALLELGPCAVPWLADESLVDETLAEALLGSSACAGVVVKPTLLGGLTRSLALARHAARCGRRVVVTHAFEGPVALAACAELALVARGELGEAVLPAGLDPHAGLGAFAALVVPQLPPEARANEPLSVEGAPVAGTGLCLEDAAWGL